MGCLLSSNFEPTSKQKDKSKQRNTLFQQMGGKKKKTKERKKTYLTNAITTCKKARKR
jgi:hypothetical protein